mmetsp:Transcript_10872/g.21037  ORF Transcript_10872/g.21037 Transcript_10872/m.21037 type:complete len:92 (+) Transcript_10872:73-348(+)
MVEAARSFASASETEEVPGSVFRDLSCAISQRKKVRDMYPVGDQGHDYFIECLEKVKRLHAGAVAACPAEGDGASDKLSPNAPTPDDCQSF